MSFRDRLRGRFRRAVAAAVRPQFNEVRADLAATRRELQAAREHLEKVMRSMEAARRNDIRGAASVRALTETELFVAENMPMVKTFPSAQATLSHALGLVTIDGLVLEFGVASGRTLRQIATASSARPVYGFDVFTGLPEDWRTGFARGMFAQRQLPDVPGATLIEGLFQDTLPAFLAEHPGPVAFLHLDADLYSSTKTVLDLLGHRLVQGSVVVLDEYFNYPGWRDGEFRAWAEYVERTGIRFRYECYTRNDQQVALTITASADCRAG